MSLFDKENDGADRCSAFIKALSEIMKEHRVKVVGEWRDLQQIEMSHDDAENGWTLDMQDIQMLTDGKSR